MKCEKHPDRDSVGNCSVCGKEVCEECLVEIAGSSYCKDCVNELVTESILKNTVNKQTQSKTTEEQTDITQNEDLNKTENENKTKSHTFRSSSDVNNILDEDIYNYDTNTETEEENSSEDYIIKPVNSVAGGISTGEYIEELEEDNPQYEKDELASYHPQEPGDLSEESYNNIGEGPDTELEAKYEKYLEDLYYDENKEESTPKIDHSKILNPKTDNIEPTQEPIPQTLKPKEETKIEPTQEPIPQTLTPKPKQRIKPELQTITEPIDNYNEEEYLTPTPKKKRINPVEEEPVSLKEEKEEEIIVPAHMQYREDNGLSYEEIRERLKQEDEIRNGSTFRSRIAEQERLYENELNEQNSAPNRNYYDDDFAPYDFDLYDEPRMPRQIHGMDEDEDKKPKNKDDGFTKGEIALSIILIILIIIVMTYVIYLFTLSNDYPSYFDAVKVLFSNPAQLFENILN